MPDAAQSFGDRAARALGGLIGGALIMFVVWAVAKALDLNLAHYLMVLFCIEAAVRGWQRP